MSASDQTSHVRASLQSLDREPALSFAQHHRTVLGRQRHRRPPRRRPHSAGDLVGPALGIGRFFCSLPFAWRASRCATGARSAAARPDHPGFRRRHRHVHARCSTGRSIIHQALNTLLLQSAGPLVVAVWSLILLGVRLTLAQAIGVLLSLSGVLVILLHGDLPRFRIIRVQQGRPYLLVAMVIFGLYSVLSLKRPVRPWPVCCHLHLRRGGGHA